MEVMASYDMFFQNGSDSENSLDASSANADVNHPSDSNVVEMTVMEQVVNLMDSSSPISVSLDEKTANIHHEDTLTSCDSSLESNSLLSSFLNTEDGTHISDEHYRKIMIFMLEKIDKFDKQISEEKETNHSLNNKIKDLESSNCYLIENIKDLLKKNSTNNILQEKYILQESI